MFTAGQNEATDSDHIHVADRLADDGECVVTDLAIWHQIVRTDQIARINVGFRNELVDIDGAIDRDHDGTLDKRELAGRLSAKEFAAADPDHDGTLTKDEYLAVVEQRFNAANQDSDGTLDAKEFGTKAGQSLMRLLR